jgi:hypothetical protein
MPLETGTGIQDLNPAWPNSSGIIPRHDRSLDYQPGDQRLWL